MVPLEQALGRLGDPRSEIVPGWSRTTLTIPTATTPQVNGILRSVPLPPGAQPPWVQARPPEVSTWIVTGADEAALLTASRTLVEVGSQLLGPGAVWTTTDTSPVWTAEVLAPLPAGELAERSAAEGASEPDGAAPAEGLRAMLAREVGGHTLRSRLVADPAPVHPDRSATWNDRPAVVVHAAGGGAELRKLARQRYPELELVPWPEEGYRVELWGADAEERAAEVVAAARAAGAEGLGVVGGRGPLPVATARRAEVIVVGPAPAELAGLPTEAWTARTAAAFAEGGATSPPPGPEWDVRIDPAALARLGVTAEEVARQLRWRTSGVALTAPGGGQLRLTWGPPPDTAEELAARTLALPAGPAPVSEVATVRRVEVPRYRRRD